MSPLVELKTPYTHVHVCHLHVSACLYSLYVVLLDSDKAAEVERFIYMAPVILYVLAAL